MLGRGSGGDKGSGLVPIHVGSRHLIRVFEAEARKLERTPLNRQVLVAITRNHLGSRLKMDAHRRSLRPYGALEYWFSCFATAYRAGECQGPCSSSLRTQTARGALRTACPSGSQQAEGEGFEPSIRLTTDNGFRDRRIRPLCHPSDGSGASALRSGEGGIRTLEGGIHPPNALAGRRLQPLGHFSVPGNGTSVLPGSLAAEKTKPASVGKGAADRERAFARRRGICEGSRQPGSWRPTARAPSPRRGIR